MLTKFKLAASSVAMAAALMTSMGCNTQPDHPNQISVLDGTSYDSLTLAHGALTSLRVQLTTSYPQYKQTFNQAAAAYSAALSAYSLYRTNPSDTSDVTLAIQNLTANIVILENSFESDMQVSGSSVAEIRARAWKIRDSAGPDVSAIDILTELEIAASVAETVPQAKPYAALAAIVIAATESAIDAEDAAAGQAIDLSTIQPIPAIS